jgi:hypothetical protein
MSENSCSHTSVQPNVAYIWYSNWKMLIRFSQFDFDFSQSHHSWIIHKAYAWHTEQKWASGTWRHPGRRIGKCWVLTTSGVLAPSVWDVESALLRAPSLPLVEPVSSGGLVDSRSSITRSMGILPFKQLMYRWQKLSHNSWTCRERKCSTYLTT